MKKETKRGLAVVGSLVGTGLAIWGITKAKAAPPVICTPGDEKCIGPDWCGCNPAGTKWIVVVKDSTVCIPVLTATLYGTVTDADTGVPIEGISVDRAVYYDTTGSDGSYRIEDIPPGEYSVVFSDPLNRYEPLTIVRTLEEGLNTLNVSLTPLPPGYVEYEEGIKLKELEISSPAVVGYPVTVSCWALSNRTQTKTFTLYVNGTEVDSQTIKFTQTFLWTTERVELQCTPASPGIYTVCIALSPYEEGLLGSFEATAPVFVNTPLELVKSATEFPDEIRKAYTTNKGNFSGPFLSGKSKLKDAYFTFDPTVVQPEYTGLCSIDTDCPPDYPVCQDGRCYHISEWTRIKKIMPIKRIPNANLNCTIWFDLGGFKGWSLRASLIAVKASEYANWLNGIRFIDWGARGILGGGIYGLGFPKIIETRTVGSICGDYDCQAISKGEKYGGWQGCNLRSGNYEVNVKGLLDLEPGSWVVLASFTMSICAEFMSGGTSGIAKPPPPEDRGPGPHMIRLPVNCHNYKIYEIGTIDF